MMKMRGFRYSSRIQISYEVINCNKSRVARKIFSNQQRCSFNEKEVESCAIMGKFIIFCDLIIKAMVEVIHRFYNSYPFGLEKETQNTFVLILKENLSEKEISLYRQKNKILKEIAGSNLIKLQRILKEDNCLHLLYEYFPVSLANYIESIKNQSKFPREKCRALSIDFTAGIDSIVDQLIRMEIKADIFLCNLAVVVKEKDGIQLKVFIEPEAEFLTLIEHHYRPKEWKRKDISTNNQEYLNQFYEGERKRLNMEFQQLLEHYFGKIQEPEKKTTPNFVINGTKLLFINQDKQETNNPKNSKIQNIKPRQTREKVEQKVQQCGRLEQQQKQTNSAPVLLKGKPQLPVQKPQIQKQQKKKVQKIVNFDQSFEPEFKPEQFTNQNTYILQENDYLQSLQEELVKLASQKKLTPNVKAKFGKAPSNEKSKQQSTTEQKKNNESQKSIENQKENSKSGNPQNSSNSINQNQSNSNVSSQDNEYEGLQICKIQPKETAIIEEKIFKYKMKIITSHQIEIEGDGQPNVEEIEREIMEGIKTGKLNINDLAAKKGSQNKSTQMNNSNNSNQSIKEPMTGSAHTQKSAPTGNFLKENGGKIVQSNHEGSKRESNLNTNPQVLQTRSSDLQQAKLKSINEIIEKIGIRANQTQNMQQSKQSRVNSVPQQEQLKTATTPHYKTEKIEINEEKMEKADNYLLKIREAKEKAEHILRQYTKKKQ